MSCLQQKEEGVWIATDPDNGIARAVLRFNCQDQILNGEPYPPGPAWYVHLWGNCSPSDCDWGEVGGRRIAEGVIYAAYDHGFARRGVHIKAYSHGELWMYIYTHFTDNSGRADYETEQFFRPAGDSLQSGASLVEIETFRKRNVPKGLPRNAMITDTTAGDHGTRLTLRDVVKPLPAPSGVIDSLKEAQRGKN